MDDMRIEIHSKAMAVRGSEVDRLESLCQGNGILFLNVEERGDNLQHSALMSLVTISFSPEVITGLATGVVSGLIVEAILQVIRVVRDKFFTKRSDHCDLIELSSSNAYLKIESDQFSDEVYNKAFTAFIEVSKSSRNDSRGLILPTFIVIDGNEAKTMTHRDFIDKYTISYEDKSRRAKTMDKLKMHTPNLADENYRKLAELFPNAVTETIDENGKVVRAIDADVLRQEIATHVVEGRQERYQFTWPDKRKAILTANAPINKTLRPCPAESVGRDGAPGGFDSENLYIEGDNLEVLKLLQETYLKKVKMIYIDPPYNTGNNLIYHNDFVQNASDYVEHSGQRDEVGNRLVLNAETNGRFHTDWLNMIYPRLRLAKSLLKDDGLLVVAIDENELDTVSMVLKQVFGETNYEHTCVTVLHNPRGQQGMNFSHTNEYAIFVYLKSSKIIADRRIADGDVSWSQLRNWGGESERTDAKNCFYPILVKDGEILGFGEVCSDDFHPSQTEVIDEVSYVYPIDQSGVERKWRYARQTVESIRDMLRARKRSYGYEIEIGKTFGVQKTVWSDKRYDANEYGTKIVADLVPNSGFSFPKSLWTVYDSVYSGTAKDKGCIVLDFFSGSATTAHAVMQLNAEDGGHRKFIMVQLPEKTDEKSEAYKAGYKNICEIGKERIRRAGAKIKREMSMGKFDIDPNQLVYRVPGMDDKYALTYREAADDETLRNLDIGFRVLKCDESNMKPVYYTPAETEQEQMDLLADNIKEDRSPEDLLFQVMLDMGVELSSSIEVTEIAGKKVFDVGHNFLLACFDRDVAEETVSEIAKRRPTYFAMRDSSMADDTVAANFEQIFRTYSPDTVRRVL